MIGIIFNKDNQIAEVRINGNNILFRNSDYTNFVPFEALKLDKESALKEFPDLITYGEDWKKEASVRFKKHFTSLKTEKDKANYVIEELKKIGYIPYAYQKPGSRVKKFKDEGRE